MQVVGSDKEGTVLQGFCCGRCLSQGSPTGHSADCGVSHLLQAGWFPEASLPPRLLQHLLFLLLRLFVAGIDCCFSWDSGHQNYKSSHGAVAERHTPTGSLPGLGEHLLADPNSHPHNCFSQHTSATIVPGRACLLLSPQTRMLGAPFTAAD